MLLFLFHSKKEYSYNLIHIRRKEEENKACMSIMVHCSTHTYSYVPFLVSPSGFHDRWYFLSIYITGQLKSVLRKKEVPVNR